MTDCGALTKVIITIFQKVINYFKTRKSNTNIQNFRSYLTKSQNIFVKLAIDHGFNFTFIYRFLNGKFNQLMKTVSITEHISCLYFIRSLCVCIFNTKSSQKHIPRYKYISFYSFLNARYPPWSFLKCPPHRDARKSDASCKHLKCGVDISQPIMRCLSREYWRGDRLKKIFYQRYPPY